MRRWIAGLCAALVCAGASHAEDQRGTPPPEQREQKPPLSKEDAELVKELALLEQLDLVKNLELFQPEKDEPPERQQ